MNGALFVVGKMSSPMSKRSLVFRGHTSAISALARSYVVRALTANDGYREQLEAVALRVNGSESLIDVSRLHLLLQKGKSRISLYLDLGCSVSEAGRGNKDFSEATFRLEKGDPSVLFSVARLCMEESNGGLQPASHDPHVRAAASQYDQTLLLPANKIDVDQSQTLEEVYEHGLDFCAQRALALSPMLAGRNDGEPLRQMRVLLRRFRTFERVFRPYLPSDALRKLAKDARRFTRILGQARDWRIFVSQTLPGLQANAETLEGIEELNQAATQRQLAADEYVLETVNSGDYSIFLLDFLEAADTKSWLKRGESARPITQIANIALEARFDEARAHAQGLVLKDLAAGHPLRLSLKKLRYTAQLFRDLYERDARKPYFRALSRLQDGFGALNDAAVAQELATQAASGEGKAAMRAAGFVSGYCTAQAQADTARILDDWAAFSAMTPYWR